MPEIQTLLREYGDRLEEMAPAITVEEVEQVGVVPPIPASPWQRPAWVAVLAAAIVLLVIGGLGLLVWGLPADDPVSSTSLPAPTTSVPAPTVPTTVAEATPETTTPPRPEVGDPAEVHPDELFVAAKLIEVELAKGEIADLRLFLHEYQDTGFFGSVVGRASPELFAFVSIDDAVEYIANRQAEEQDEELSPLALGDESVSYLGAVGRGGQATHHLVRVDRFVVAALEFDENFDFEELASIVAALESSFSPTLSAFYGPVEILEPLEPDAQALSYTITSWDPPLGDIEGGDRASFSFGYQRDGQNSCTYWSGGVEPTEYIIYTPTGGTVSKVVLDVAQRPVQDSVVALDDPEYLEALDNCNRYPPLADQWGLGDHLEDSVAEFEDDFVVHQVEDDQFVLVRPQMGFSTVEEIPLEELTGFEPPPDVSVTGTNIRVDGAGYVSIYLEFEGPRDSLEEFLGIDLSAMPNEIIGVDLLVESGAHAE